MTNLFIAMKKKHSKTAEESRYQGTALGKQADIAPITIAGSDIVSISEWIDKQAKATTSPRVQNKLESATPATSFLSSAVSTPQAGDTIDTVMELSGERIASASATEE